MNRALSVSVCVFLCIIISVKSKDYVHMTEQCKMITERRRKDPVLFEPIKVGLFSERAIFDNCRFSTFTKQMEDKWLYNVGLYIAAHKYFVKDPRFAGEKVTKPEFFKKFPSPEVSDLDPKLKQACETNATACILAVYNNGGAQSGTIQQLLNLNLTLPAWAPFKTEYDAFVFRQTAMYYLCWYTMKRDPAMIFHFKKPPDFFKTDPNMRYDLDLTCLGYLYDVKEIEPATERARLHETRDKSKLSDYRSTYENMQANPFQCAELWFCPDPCYSREDLGGFNPSEDLRQTGNPCRELENPRCEIVPEANVNFRDLVSNKFNVTCDCESSRKGYFWNSRSNTCEDINECEDQSICSFGKHCQNTEGGYQCICPPGTVENPRTTSCETIRVPTDAPKSASDAIDSSIFEISNARLSKQGAAGAQMEPAAIKSIEQVPAAVPNKVNAQKSDFEKLSNAGYYAPNADNSRTVKFGGTTKSIFSHGERLPNGRPATRTAKAGEAVSSPKNEIMSYKVHAAGGLMSSNVQKTVGQTPNEAEVSKNVDENDNEESPKYGEFLSGFMGFISAGNRNVPVSQTLCFAVFFLVVCQRCILDIL